MSDPNETKVLNVIDVKRASMTFDLAILVWLWRLQGMTQHVIAAMIGINQGRISEVLTGKVHHGSQEAARRLIG